jgi:cytochrome c biogenesis protein CcmG, thiol:disulfide interchange protein DsbE
MGEGVNPLRARKRRTVLIVGALGLVVVLLAMLGHGLHPASSGALVGQPAPDFTVGVFFGEQYGEMLTRDGLRGEVVILHIWASWCKECRPEMLMLEGVWQAYRDRGVTVLGVDYLDTDAAGLAYLEDLGVSFPNGPDVGSQVYQAYHCSGVPETFVIDQAGLVRYARVGVMSETELRAVVDDLISGEGAGLP